MMSINYHKIALSQMKCTIELKVLTISRDMDGPFSGMSLKIDEDRFMIVNSAHSQISTTQRYSHFDYEQARTKLEIL